jgi:hypothetical protein
MSKMTDKTKLYDRLRDIAVRSEKMKVSIIAPQFEAGTFIKDDGLRFEAVSASLAAGGLMLASAVAGIEVEAANIIGPAWSAALQEYANENNGAIPCDELLAAAHQSAENILNYMASPATTPSQAGMMLASVGATTGTTSGILDRARVVATILPVYLRCATNHAVTLIPAGKDIAEIFRLTSLAASTSGEYVKNQIIAEGSMGQFTQQRQRYVFATGQQPNNVRTEFVFDTSTDLPSAKKHAIKNNTVVIYHERKPVAQEKDGQLFGSILVGGTTYTLSGTVDHINGVATLASSPAIPNGKLHFRFEIDIEADPTLIPSISHKMSVVEVRPYEVSVSSQASLQSLHKMRREHGIDTESLLVNTMTNLVAYETDTRRLRDMAFCVTNVGAFNKHVPAGSYFKEKYEEFAEFMTQVDSSVTKANKKSGIIGAYVGLNASAFLQAMGSSFVHVPNYKRIPQVHLVGTLFGKYRIYEVPTELEDLTADDILWYAKGSNHGDSGYVAGTAIAPISFKHDIQGNLVHSDTMWGTEYGEVHPDNGAAYFAKTTITNIAP